MDKMQTATLKVIEAMEDLATLNAEEKDNLLKNFMSSAYFDGGMSVREMEERINWAVAKCKKGGWKDNDNPS